MSDINLHDAKNVVPSQQTGSTDNEVGFAYVEAKETFLQLMNDIEYLDDKSNRLIQTSLVVAGILATAAANINIPAWTPLVDACLLVSAVLFAVSALLAFISYLSRDFAMGRVFPRDLFDRRGIPTDEMRKSLFEAIVKSWEYNYSVFRTKAKCHKAASYVQIAGVIMLSIALALLLANIAPELMKVK
jgi:hypothetical protein